MIEPIPSHMKEYSPTYAYYGVTKFIAKDGSGHRGVILEISTDGAKAVLFGITGEYTGVLVYVVEVDENHWPEEKEQLGNLFGLLDTKLSTYLDADLLRAGTV